MRQNRISENGGGDRVLENSAPQIPKDVVKIRPIVTSEASMKTTCDVNAAEIATNCTSDMMNGTESVLKCTTSVVEATTPISQAAITFNTTYREKERTSKSKRKARQNEEIQTKQGTYGTEPTRIPSKTSRQRHTASTRLEPTGKKESGTAQTGEAKDAGRAAQNRVRWRGVVAALCSNRSLTE
ncbi:hypothetical protein DPMN_131226 [Dreissena polymorpha]|uniref:Uncharacterized protein n=1 Tax=Dreissena polymorpha TaxID=45954 RepID=A0A9D4HCH1_DREPO|nr:hypothetical protein DPMN_131226 [Dreissena polymorpha]